jgi:hypothetical protein
MEHITKQSKLTKEEWESIEVPLPANEKQILALIQAGFHDVNISRNSTPTLSHHMKIVVTPAIDMYIYIHYFQAAITKLVKKYLTNVDGNVATVANVKEFAEMNSASLQLKKADLIRLENTYKHIVQHKPALFEFIVMELLEKLLKHKCSKKPSREWIFYYYTINKLLGYGISDCNTELRKKVTIILSMVVTVDASTMKIMLEMGQQLIEKNAYLLKYSDETLYDHQKQLFSLCKQRNPKLILYIAPTGTGKTMSPLGLSEKYRVIFVCAARHVGLALAKAAISMQKKIAFAFGCKDAEDIRLHYYAAKEYTINMKSGGIGKVDNSHGEKVEIIISDVQSYIPAMLYMLAFNPKERIIMYWDEPTITLDYPTHELHAIIQKNWNENLIPNVVLSSATLPQQDELSETILDFKARFSTEEVDAELHEIVSYDCKKTIPLINREGCVEMPHYLFADYAQILAVVEHCKQYKTLLRYIDLEEAIHFISFIEEHMGKEKEKEKEKVLLNDCYRAATHFTDITTLNMYAIKMFYLNVLGNLNPNAWPALYQQLQDKRKKRFASTVNIVTTDAHTLTDGPTLFLADDVTKIAQFYIQSAKIPEHVIKEIMDKIHYNTTLNDKVFLLEKEVEDGVAKDSKGKTSSKTGKDSGKAGGKDSGKSRDSGKSGDERISPELKEKKQQIEDLRACIKMVMLNPIYVPNTNDHLYKHAAQVEAPRAFTSNVSEHMVEEIMQISDIDDFWKLLLMMGIGVFAAHKSTKYVELMKRMVQEQNLFMIIATTDYIYGTNYQLCHGYIGKDLATMSQEKCIQAMGRVGRNKLQQDYSVRFRDNALLYKLFQRDDNKPEVANMRRLFSGGASVAHALTPL